MCKFVNSKLLLVLGTVMIALLMSQIALAADSTIADIDDHWAQEQIIDWIDKGLAQGYEDGMFRPGNSITRAEFIAFVNKMFGYTEQAAISFPDVASHHWYAEEVAKAQAAGYVSGYEDNTFRPNNPISRQEADCKRKNNSKWWR